MKKYTISLSYKKNGGITNANPTIEANSEKEALEIIEDKYPDSEITIKNVVIKGADLKTFTIFYSSGSKSIKAETRADAEARFHKMFPNDKIEIKSIR